MRRFYEAILGSGPGKSFHIQFLHKVTTERFSRHSGSGGNLALSTSVSWMVLGQVIGQVHGQAYTVRPLSGAQLIFRWENGFFVLAVEPLAVETLPHSHFVEPNGGRVE